MHLNEEKKRTELDLLLGELKLLLNDECLKIVEFLKDNNLNISPVTYNTFLNIICETAKKVLTEKFTRVKYLEEESRQYESLKAAHSTLKDNYSKALHGLRQAEFEAGGLTQRVKLLENDISNSKNQVDEFNSKIDQIRLNYSLQLQTYKDEIDILRNQLESCRNQHQLLLAIFSDFKNEHADCMPLNKEDSDEKPN